MTGHLAPDSSFRFCSDSRLFQPGDMFFCIPGEKFNPVIFVDELISRGLSQVVVESHPANEVVAKNWLIQNPNLVIVWSHSVSKLIQELAHQHVMQWKTDKRKVIAISGSNGKTTTKEMLSFLLKGALGESHVVSTEKNNNNQLGVPFTIFNIHQLTEAVVLEFGSNHPGEIKVLCDIANPDWALTTNIGQTHLEFFKTEEAVFEEEAYVYHEILRQPEPRRRFFLNVDDLFLQRLDKNPWVQTYGENPEAQYSFKFEPQKVKIDGPWQAELTNHNITGKHNFYNLAVAWLVATNMFPEHQGTFSFLASEFRPTLNRSEWRQWGATKVFLDAYNANPSSMRVAIEGFLSHIKNEIHDQRQVALIIGDMNELGERAPELHRDLAAHLAQSVKCDICFIGRYREFFKKGCPSSLVFENVTEFKKQHLKTLMNGKSHLFIKASRSLQLESILDIT